VYTVSTYYAARNNGYTVRRAAPFVGKALALAHSTAQGLGPPHGPYREGWAAAPLGLSPGLCGPGWSVVYFTYRTVRCFRIGSPRPCAHSPTTASDTALPRPPSSTPL